MFSGHIKQVLSLLRLTTVMLLLPSAANAEQGRIALVIGNGSYKETAALKNTKNDAAEISAALRRLNFDVLYGVDLDKRAMERLIRQFDQKLTGTEIALFFYAGHGIQASGQNFLVPVDARLTAEGDLDFESLPLNLILRRMEREAKTSLILLDACRDNPLARNLARRMGTRSSIIGQGLAEVKTGVGTLISFSTQPGNVALDGDGRNSPYTTALLKHMESPGRDVLSILAAVRGDVVQATSGRQVPWEHTSLLGPLVLRKPLSSQTPPPPQSSQPNPVAPSAPSRNSEAAEAWQATKDSTNLNALEAFIRRYGDSFYGDLARARLGELTKSLQQNAPRPAANSQQPIGVSAGATKTGGAHQKGPAIRQQLTMKPGSMVQLLDGRHRLGFVQRSLIGTATLNFDGNEHILKFGQSIAFKSGGQDCQVVLGQEEISTGITQFLITCQ